MYILDTAEEQYEIDRDPARFHPGEENSVLLNLKVT